MSKQTEALKLALEAEDQFDKQFLDAYEATYGFVSTGDPTCYQSMLHAQDWAKWAFKKFASPQPSKPWVGLTDEEITDTLLGYRLIDALDIYRAIEAKLREKNELV